MRHTLLNTDRHTSPACQRLLISRAGRLPAHGQSREVRKGSSPARPPRHRPCLGSTCCTRKWEAARAQRSGAVGSAATRSPGLWEEQAALQLGFTAGLPDREPGPRILLLEPSASG